MIKNFFYIVCLLHLSVSAQKTENICFYENKGQVRGFDKSEHPEVRYVYSNNNVSVFLMENGLAYQFCKSEKKDVSSDDSQDFRFETHRVNILLEGISSNVSVVAKNKSLDYINDYRYNALNIKGYQKIIYKEVYPGIDWVIYSNSDGIKYDFILKPYADPSVIKLKITNADYLAINKNKDLMVNTRLGQFFEKKPISTQEGNEIETEFILNNNILTFKLNDYDKSKQLIIDPSVSWSTYYGGNGDDPIKEVETDLIGNIYAIGNTSSSNMIASSGYQNTLGGVSDVFLVKFNSSGLRQWATYYGGSNDDSFACLSLDLNGNIIVGGRTSSATNISFNGYKNTLSGANDAFIVKFNSSGIRKWATYYGGNGEESASSVDADQNGNIFFAGETKSTSNISSGGHQNTFGGGTFDAYLVKLDSSGNRIWATYYGGAQNDAFVDCEVDKTGNVYISGQTSSTNNVFYNGHQNNLGGGSDLFLAKFNTNGIRQWATYYGGSGSELQGSTGKSCEIDQNNNVFLYGGTYSNSGISYLGYQNSLSGNLDGFIAKFDSTGSRVWGTYYGGNSYDRINSCAFDNNLDVTIVGYTKSVSDIALSGFKNTHANNGGSYYEGFDGFIAKLNTVGSSRMWGSYFGGVDFESINDCAIFGSDTYIVGATFSSSSIASGGHQNTFGGGTSDGFIAKIFDPTTHTFEVQNVSDLEVFPNPSNGIIYLNSKQDGFLRVTNILNQVIVDKMISKGNEVIDLSYLPKGTYFVQFKTDKTKKLVKKIVLK